MIFSYLLLRPKKYFAITYVCRDSVFALCRIAACLRMTGPLYIQIIEYSVSKYFIGSQNQLKCISCKKRLADATRKGHVLPGCYQGVFRHEGISADNTLAYVPHETLSHLYAKLIISPLQIPFKSDKDLFSISFFNFRKLFFARS